jgi:molecular chaperone DnaK
MAMGYALGLDLGTTFTAAAVHRNGQIEMVSLGNRASVIPSLVFLREDEEILVGDAAERRGLTEPRRLAREFKRRMGDSAPIMLGSSPYSAERIMAAVMREVVDNVSQREGGAPDSVAITYPANWGPYKTDLLRQAANLAGLRDAALLTEPIAAALHYASTERVDPGSVVAIYDLGGGTFDAAVLRKTDDGFEQLGDPEGIERLGGIDFDEAVFRHVREALGESFDGLDHDDPAVRSATQRLRQECSAAKEALSSDTDATIPVMLPGLQTEIRVTRPEFEAMVRPTLRETVEALKRAIASAGMTPADLHAVLLVGGSSRIPLVAELVSSELGRPVAVDAHPKHAVALGAALVAAESAGGSGAPAAGPPAPAPTPPASSPPPPSPPSESPAPSPPPAEPRPAPQPAASPAAPARDPAGARAGRGVLVAALVALVLVAAGIAYFVTRDDGAETAAEPTAPTTSLPDQVTTGGTTVPECTSASGRCAFITDLRLEGGSYVAEYAVEGFEPVIFEPGVKGSPRDHHVHFYFDTVDEVNAGTNGPNPSTWAVWDRDSGRGELVFDAFSPANQTANAGAGATSLCVAVADSDHGIETGTGNCVPLP